MVDESRLGERLRALDRPVDPPSEFVEGLYGALSHELEARQRLGASEVRAEQLSAVVELAKPKATTHVPPIGMRGALAAGMVVLVAIGVVWLVRPLSTEETGPPATAPNVVDLDDAVTTLGSTEQATTLTIRAIPGTLEELGRPLAELVDGLEGALVATVGPVGKVDLVYWAADGHGGGRGALPGALGQDLSLDASYTRMAYLIGEGEPVQSFALYTGLLGSGLRVWSEVHTYAWHTTAAQQLAWIGRDPDADTYSLYTASLGQMADQIEVRRIIAATEDDILHAWDSAGFLLTTWDPVQGVRSLQRLDPDGRLVSQLEESFGLASVATDGRLLFVQYQDAATRFFVADPLLANLEPLTWAPADARAENRLAAWSPNGDRIAFLTYDGSTSTSWELEVWAASGTLLQTVPFHRRSWDVTWSPEGRFVVMPSTDNAGTHAAIIYDTQDERLYEVEFDSWIQRALIIPSLNADQPVVLPELDGRNVLRTVEQQGLTWVMVSYWSPSGRGRCLDVVASDRAGIELATIGGCGPGAVVPEALPEWAVGGIDVQGRFVSLAHGRAGPDTETIRVTLNDGTAVTDQPENGVWLIVVTGYDQPPFKRIEALNAGGDVLFEVEIVS